MILLIDNYDSFTYNLYQQLSGFGQEVVVEKNDTISLEEISDLDPKRIVLGPGPKTPADSGICIPLIKEFAATRIPILGICLGHQCLAVAFGQKVIPAKRLVYGKTTTITTRDTRLMADLEDSFEVARYHSLVIDAAPPHFHASSHDVTGDIMSIEHNSQPIFGLQFHPESFLMVNKGNSILKRFLAF